MKQNKENTIKKNKATMYNKIHEKVGNKLFAAKYIINDVINNNKAVLDDNGNITTPDGDSFDSLIKNILEENKDSLKSNQNPGSGESPKDDSLKVEELDLKNMSVEDAAKNADRIMGAIKKQCDF